jgi:LysM repeat protein
LSSVWQPADANIVALYNQMAAGYQAGNYGAGYYAGGYSLTGGGHVMTPYLQPTTYASPVAAGNQVLYEHYAPAQAVQGQQATTTGSGPVAAPATTSAPVTAAAPAPAADAGTRKNGTGKQKTGTKDGQKAQQQEPQKAEPKRDPKPEPKTVTVKAGDSLSKIAAANGVSWQKLYALNKGVIGGDPNLIRPGQRLKMP